MRSFLTSLCVIVVLWIGTIGCLYITSKPKRQAINEAIEFVTNHNLRTDIICLCDFSIHSGRPRFWIYDCVNGKIIARSLCAHGYGNRNKMWKPKFSNDIGSCCSSIGMYKIVGEHKLLGKYNSLKVKGLSPSNSNTEQRGILIHTGFTAHTFRYGIFPFYIPLTKESEGCFAINRATLNTIMEQTATKKQQMLLYAYY